MGCKAACRRAAAAGGLTQKMTKRSLSRWTGRGEGWAGSYVASGEGEHGEEDDGQFGFRYFGTNSSEDGHDGAGLKTETGTSGCLFIAFTDVTGAV